MEKISPEGRSRIMRSVRSKNTRPEKLVRSLIHRLGYRFRIHYKKLPGCPDLAFPAKRKVIFVHGCFWHGHGRCRSGKLPLTNTDYWHPKILGNIERDKKNQSHLKKDGWKILTLWGCQLEKIEKLEKQLIKFLS